MHRHVRTVADLLSLMDGVFAAEADRRTSRAGDWWDRFHADLRWIFQDLTELELRRMTEEPSESAAFGKSFRWTALFRGN